MVDPASNLRAGGDIRGVRHDRPHHVLRHARTLTHIQYSLSFYIQIGMVAGFILAFLFLSKNKLDSRRRLSEDLIENFIDQKDSILTTQNADAIDNNKEAQKKHYKLSYMFGRLMKSKMYLVGTFTMAVILYVSTGIQFWLTDYYINVLGFAKERVFAAYAIVSVTGPTSGAGFGNLCLI